MAKLTPTSFALLGLLAHRAWSAYELNKAMQGSIVRASWPRVESRIYSEIRNLEKHCLVEGEKQRQGGRARTVYTITDDGRRSLVNWLENDNEREGMRLEYETLLKLGFSDQGHNKLTDELLDKIEAQTLEEMEVVIAGCEVILKQRGWNNSDTGHLHVLTIRFVNELSEAKLAWVNKAREYLNELDCNDTASQSLALYEEEIKRLRSVLQRYPAKW